MDLTARSLLRADLGGHAPQDAKHCATWHWNNTMLVCTAIKNAINGIKLCLSYSPGLKFQAVYFKKCCSFWGLRPQGPCLGFALDPTGGLPSPDPLIWPPTSPSRSALVAISNNNLSSRAQVTGSWRSCWTDWSQHRFIVLLWTIQFLFYLLFYLLFFWATVCRIVTFQSSLHMFLMLFTWACWCFYHHHHHFIMCEPPRRGIKRWCCLTSVCLKSVVYIGPKSRTERPRKTKIGTEVANVTPDSDTTFKVKRSKVKVTGCGGILWRPPAQLARS